jgi:hypothetical protein
MVAYVTYRRVQARMGMHARMGTSLAVLSLAGVALLGMAACSKLGLGGGDDQMTWAKAALERNGRLEVVAADPQTSTFTVRVKDTGELRMIKADQVVAEPAGLSAPSGAAPTETSAPSEPAAPAQPAPESSGVNTPTATASTNSPPEQSSMTRPADETAANVPRTGFKPEPAPAAAAPNPNSDVASITPGGRTLESGPGYAIKVASKDAASSATRAPARERSTTTSAAVERRHEPIICQGERLLQIDNRNLEFDGDAVSAEDGCEIHITNSHITAKGVGISARAANVHIDNSQIEGDSASIDASGGAQIYASSSRFKGMSRRLDNSSFHDLGGNVWN